ncbi:hypothetical protein PHJA_002212400 [Phtheirospermum japonicum]|uniref:Uncharacterized protein n=1 Tax=Phtheirospermum japonicum TaxID=374723 RepID=A0A830CX17_9LAMI|nr:hypothetical protein PHJA_002212400 [Phtheirospermum japonicum]
MCLSRNGETQTHIRRNPVDLHPHSASFRNCVCSSATLTVLAKSDTCILDELLSPPFSSSPSSSLPTYPLNHFQSWPLSIPHPMMARSPRYLSPKMSDPSRNSLPPLSLRNTKYDHSSHELPSGIRVNLSRDAKEDSGRFSSLPSSSSSPRVGFSRSSSRLSFQADFGDMGFSCPFIVDGVDTPDSQRR